VERNVTVAWLALLFRIQDVAVLNLDPEVGYREIVAVFLSVMA
jgi:hypothetical protein